MAWQFKTNQTPATGAAAVYLLFQALAAAGWKDKADSDGTTYSSSGGQVTGGGSGANGLGNVDAWTRWQDPAGLREFTFQRGADNQHWRVKYSKSAQFTGGSPSATQTPSASDEHLIMGGGSDASPSFAAWFGGADGSYRFSCAADSAATPVKFGATTYNVYRFFTFGFPTGGGNPNHGFAIDPLHQTLNANTYEYEQDPVVIYNGVGTGTPWAAAITNQNNFMGWIYSGANSASWSSNMYTDANTNFVTGNTFGVGPRTGNDYGGKVLFYAPTTLAWPKGYGTFIRQHLSGNGGSVTRNTGQGLTLNTAGDYILVGFCELPWDGSTPLI